VNNLLQLNNVVNYLAEKHHLEAQAKDRHTTEEKTLFAKLQGIYVTVLLFYVVVNLTFESLSSF